MVQELSSWRKPNNSPAPAPAPAAGNTLTFTDPSELTDLVLMQMCGHIGRITAKGTGTELAAADVEEIPSDAYVWNGETEANNNAAEGEAPEYESVFELVGEAITLASATEEQLAAYYVIPGMK